MADDPGLSPEPSRPADATPPPGGPQGAVPVFRPLLPRAERLLPYLRRIDATRLYSNRGPLVEALEGRLADLIAVPPHGLRLAASGTAALMLAILAHAGRGTAQRARPLALMPAFTFVATAQAAEMCGWRPVFADVDPLRWTLDPDAVRAHPDFARAGLVVVAAPYGILPDIAGLARLQAETGVPLVIDAAAGFEALCDAPGTVSATVPMVLSFHATKSFSTGEGGAVAWDCPEGQRRVMQIANFGFMGTRAARSLGMNAKMSEYHAAVGLAMLDDLATRRAAQARVAETYARAARRGGLAGALHLPPRISPAYALYEAPDTAAGTRAEAALHDAAIESRRWYGGGVDREPWYAGPRPADPGAAPPLPVTRGLCGRLLGLPTAPDLDAPSIARIVAALVRAEAGSGTP